jgi:CubicO group peptidase (beta-lactamase class C family)
MRALPVLVLSLLLETSCGAQVSFEDGLKAHLNKLTNDELPGLAVLVSRDGKIAFQAASASRSRGENSCHSGDKIPDRLRLEAIHGRRHPASRGGRQARARRQARKVFPRFSTRGEITLRQLLTHTSGIHSYTSKPEFMARVVSPISAADLIAWFREDPADFAPGAGFLYNNSAYFLAGEIVAKVSGQSLDAYLRATFFDPLGMKDSGVFVNSAPPPGIARGYSMNDGKPAPALDWDMSWAGGAGALYSTVGDLFRWNEALFGGRVLKPESFQLMTTPVQLPAGVDGMRYGYGLAIASVQRLPADRPRWRTQWLG